ncbi:MAG: hypothetical protein Q9227_002699 [Pyrenula ochraceoflavens]
MQRWTQKQGQCIYYTQNLHSVTSSIGSHGRIRCFQTNKSRDRKSASYRIVSSEGSEVRNLGKARSQYPAGDYDAVREYRGRSQARDKKSSWSRPLGLSRLISHLLDKLNKQLTSPGQAKRKIIQNIYDLDPKLRHWSGFEKHIVAPTAHQITEPPALSALQQVLNRDGQNGVSRALEFMYIDWLSQKDITKEDSVARAKIADLRYPTEWFPAARAIQREIHLHIGPTNSGKTYSALKRLESAKTGFYAGPLRLLAHEVYSRFNAKGIRCGLITGDDIQGAEESPPHTSHTVEMSPMGRSVDVAVVDEIQMIGDPERGWAWTNTVLGARAQELHLCGEARVLPLIRALAASMGDTLHVHSYERLNPLKAMDTSLKNNLGNLEKGDCVVAFTVIGLHAMKNEIERRTGRRCAIVYGSLPPEIRAQQAELFNNPDNDFDFLVASDAIGMGLNLSIKRLIFDTTWKNNGKTWAQLSVSALKQIAGRAGRYRVAGQEKEEATDRGSTNVGLVTSLSELDLPYIQQALSSEPSPILKAGLLPPTQVVERFCSYFPKEVPFHYILRRLHNHLKLSDSFFPCDIDSQCTIASSIDKVAGLSILDRHTFCASPATVRKNKYEQYPVLEALARCVAEQQGELLKIPEIQLEALDEPVSGERTYLRRMEQLHKALILYIWLSYRFTGVFVNRPLAFYAKELVEEKMNQAISEFSANKKLRQQFMLHKQALIEAALEEEAQQKERREREQAALAAEDSSGTEEPAEGMGMPPDQGGNVSVSGDPRNELAEKQLEQPLVGEKENPLDQTLSGDLEDEGYGSENIPSRDAEYELASVSSHDDNIPGSSENADNAELDKLTQHKAEDDQLSMTNEPVNVAYEDHAQHPDNQPATDNVSANGADQQLSLIGDDLPPHATTHSPPSTFQDLLNDFAHSRDQLRKQRDNLFEISTRQPVDPQQHDEEIISLSTEILQTKQSLEHISSEIDKGIESGTAATEDDSSPSPSDLRSTIEESIALLKEASNQIEALSRHPTLDSFSSKEQAGRGIMDIANPPPEGSGSHHSDTRREVERL